MNIYEFAMQKEAMSENYYRALADKCGSPGLKTILRMLADEERKHYNMVMLMEKNGKPGEAESTLLADARIVFVAMKTQRDNLSSSFDQIDLYREAQLFEKESEDYYREKAAEVKDNFQKKLFTKMAEQERKHYTLLENIIILLSRPEQWLEDAEWTHLEEY